MVGLFVLEDDRILNGKPGFRAPKMLLRNGARCHAREATQLCIWLVCLQRIVSASIPESTYLQIRSPWMSFNIHKISRRKQIDLQETETEGLAARCRLQHFEVRPPEHRLTTSKRLVVEGPEIIPQLGHQESVPEHLMTFGGTMQISADLWTEIWLSPFRYNKQPCRSCSQ